MRGRAGQWLLQQGDSLREAISKADILRTQQGIVGLLPGREPDEQSFGVLRRLMAPTWSWWLAESSRANRRKGR